MYVLVPPTKEAIVEVIQLSPQGRISERTQIDAPVPQILRDIVDSVGSQKIVVIPTLREQEVCWNTERREKMSLRDSYPASRRTPDLGELLVALV